MGLVMKHPNKTQFGPISLDESALVTNSGPLSSYEPPERNCCDFSVCAGYSQSDMRDQQPCAVASCKAKDRKAASRLQTRFMDYRYPRRLRQRLRREQARYLRLDDNCRWVLESEEVFLKTLAPEQTLNILLPGYSTTMKWVVQHLWNLNQQLEKQAKCRGIECPPTRLVIVGWPSEIDRVPLLRDAREKAHRAELEGYWLAQLIAKLPKDFRVNLIAYSFGSRIATSAAHYLAGGQRCDCPLTASPDSPRLTAVLMAAAVDADWLSDCEPHGLALNRFERVLLLNNSADPVLRRFYKVLLSSRTHPCDWLGWLVATRVEFASQVRQWDVSNLLGRSHELRSYVETPEIMWSVAEYAFYIEPKESHARLVIIFIRRMLFLSRL